MPPKKKEYGNDSLSALKGADRVRKRPGVIFGSDDVTGCEHSVFEILSNSIDEAREGHGGEIYVTRFEDGSVEVEDFGRGVPVEFNQRENEWNWHLAFCEMYAGGKYANDTGESYEYSLGLNGLGLCATQYASEYMEVTIWRDGNEYSLSFQKGENVGGLRSVPFTKKRTGTRTRWKPDLAVFTDIMISADYYREVLKKQAVVNAGLKFIFKNEVEGKFETSEFLYENGISDYAAELCPEGGLTPVRFIQAERTGRDREDKPEYRVKMSAAFCFVNSNGVAEYYHNSSFLEHGGSPDKAVRSAFLSEIDAYLKNNGKYQKNESKVNIIDILDSLIIITNSFSNYTSYENQTKKAITNKFIYESMNEFLRHSLEVYFIENPADAEKVAEQVLINKRSRENAEKTRLNLKKKLAGGVGLTNRVQKFVDCRSRDVDLREIYIVEGDSALGACKLGRNGEFQAIIPVRGKILNCLKADYDKILKNDIITDIIKVLGCGIEVKSKSNKDLSSFDLSALRWSKIIICTDADVDGFQIRTLILTMLYRLVPTLINEGLVYIAESPLYEITAKDRTLFAYSDAEKARVVATLEGQRYTLQRSKGLGENEPDMMWMTTMNPKTRRLIRVSPADAELTSQMFDILLGDNLTGRKDFIAVHGAEYLELADIS